MAITLDYSDPVFFAICGGDCSLHRPGQNVGKYFARAYNARDWKRKPKCDNCDSDMRLLYEVKRSD